MDKTILVVEDEMAIADILVFNLQREGYRTLVANDGPEGLRLALTGAPDLVLLDVMLPGMDGFEVCRKVRETSQVPILMLTAREEEADKVMGLELGADDYITKPFSMRELMARVKANIRRTSVQQTVSGTPETSAAAGKLVISSERGAVYKDGKPLDLSVRKANIRRTSVQQTVSGTPETSAAAGKLVISSERGAVYKDGKPLDLSVREFDILTFLAAEPGKVFSREQLMENVWGYEYYGDLRAVDVAIRRLREKLEDQPAQPRYIITKRGFGYCFSDSETVEGV